jgi:hypothetical protein
MENDPNALEVILYEIFIDGRWVVVSEEEYNAWTGEKRVS